MPGHNLQQQLENVKFDSAGSFFTTAEGKTWGHGKTVGNGVEGWAPNAVYVHTDGSSGTRWYRNTGSKTTATWTPSTSLVAGEGIIAAVATSYFYCADNAYMRFGTGQDVKLMWNGTYLEGGPATGLWAGAPSPAAADYMSVAHVFEDDFNQGRAPIDANLTWHEEDDGGTGTNALADGAGGIANVITAAADNDYHAISSLHETFLFLATKKLWFEARFKVAEATTNESAWWFGLTDTLTTGGIQANNAGPLASYDGALIWKDEGTMTVDFETSNAGTQATAAASLGTFVTNTWTRVGFYFDGTATTSIIYPYVDVGAGWVAGETEAITLAGLEEMHVVAGIKAGPTAAAETLQIDFIKCVQLR